MRNSLIFLALILLAFGALAQPVHKFEKGELQNAYCSQTLDDACYINDQKVPKAKLKQYLPTVNPKDVEKDAGYCDYPLCYDFNDFPIGVRSDWKE